MSKQDRLLLLSDLMLLVVAVVWGTSYGVVKSALVFYPKYVAEMVVKQARTASLFWRMSRVRKSIQYDPAARDYMDTALTPVTEHDTDDLEMFNVTEAARAAGEKTRREAAARNARLGAKETAEAVAAD